MNIIYLFGHELKVGGHFKDAAAYAKYLVHEGHNIYVVAQGDKTTAKKIFKDTGVEDFYFYQKKKNSLGRIRNYLRPINEIQQVFETKKIDIIHAQDLSSLYLGYLASCFKKCGFIFTKAGGPFNEIDLPQKSIFTVASKELYGSYLLKNGLRKKNIYLVDQRIDTSVYRPKDVNMEFIDKYNLSEKGLTFFMAMRINQDKKHWFDTVLDIAKRIRIDNCVNFVFAGSGNLKKSVVSRFKKISEKRPQVHFNFVGDVYDENELIKFYNFADITIGHGRGIMEAMCCKKPVIVLGENGESEFITKDNIEKIKYYNFSGRHFRFQDKPVSNYISSLIELSKSDLFLENQSSFLYDYCRRELAAVKGAKKLEKIYIESKKSTETKNISEAYRFKLQKYNVFK